jgi:L1 cell adhesion molecule like protein
MLGGADMGGTTHLVLDVTPLSLGVREGAYNMHVLIKKNTTIPCKKSQTFSTGADNQTACEIAVYEGEREIVTDPRSGKDVNNLLGKFMLEGIPPMRRGQPQIEVTYDVDANGILNVSAVEKSTGKSNKITIANEKGRLSKEDIERLVEEAEKYKEEDSQMRKLLDAKNSLESYMVNWNSTLSEDKFKSHMSEEDLKTVETVLEEAKEWLDKNMTLTTKEPYEEKLKELEAVINPIAKKVYESMPADQQSGMPGMGGGMPGGMPDMSSMMGPDGKFDMSKISPEQMEQMQKMMAGMNMGGAMGGAGGPTVDEVD